MLKEYPIQCPFNTLPKSHWIHIEKGREVKRREVKGREVKMQSINEILKNLKPLIQKENTEATSSPRRIKVWHYEDGSAYYADLGVRARSGEDLTMALARLRAEKIEKLFGDAQILTRFREWDFDSFPCGEGKERAFGEARKYAEGKPRTSLFIIGEYGVGKTGLAIAVLKERIKQEVPSLYVAVPDLLDKIRATFNGHGDYTELMEAVQRIDFLVMDDLGSEYPTAWAKEKMYQLIGYRHAWELPMVATSNLTPTELETQVGERVLWRMFEMGMVVVLRGRNLRKRS